MSVTLSWAELSPTYGNFIFYCRNATTHDGSHMINAGKGVKNYITGPLRRIDNRGRANEFNPPKEDAFALSCNIAKEVFASVSNLLKLKGEAIPTPDGDDFRKGIELSLESDFIPDEIKKMIRDNKTSIISSFPDVKIDVAQQALDAIASVEERLAYACT